MAMRYCFMSFSTPALSLADMLEVAHRYGYDGIEPRLDADHAHGIEAGTSAKERSDICKQVAESVVDLACLATSLSYADPAKMDEMIQQTHERIDLAGDLAVPTMRVFGGKIPDGIGREEAIDQLVRSLGEVADHAAERDVVICMETHDDWCDPDHVVTVLERVDHAAVGANWDIMHPVRTGAATIDSSFDVLKPWIRHLHIHDGVEGLNLVPIGTGDIDHRRALELLMPTDFDGYISGEWIGWEAYDVHLPRELATMKGYELELS